MKFKDFITKYRHIIIIVFFVIVAITLFLIGSKYIASLIGVFGVLFGLIEKDDKAEAIKKDISKLDKDIKESKERQDKKVIDLKDSTNEIKKLKERLSKVGKESDIDCEEILNKLRSK